jgi:lysophospholipase L1-like esterase
MDKILRLLFLGDSYTIGEGLPIQKSYPYRLLELLRRNGFLAVAPEIRATTGFTSDELLEEINRVVLLSNYDWVMVLIGVNNQYRGNSIGAFASDLQQLAKLALEKVEGENRRVIWLSIPDWSVTKFAQEQQLLGEERAKKITETPQEIDGFNAVAQQVAEQYGFHWVNITENYRQIGGAEEAMASDGLHPSEAIYAEWANQVFSIINGTH